MIKMKMLDGIKDCLHLHQFIFQIKNGSVDLGLDSPDGSGLHFGVRDLDEALSRNVQV